MTKEQAVQACVSVLAETAGREIAADDLEVSGLDATRERRRFFRLRDEALAAALDAG